MPTQELTAQVFVNTRRATTPTELTVKRSSAHADPTAAPKAAMASATTLTGDEIPELTRGMVFINTIPQMAGTIHNTEDHGDGSHGVTIYDGVRSLRQHTLTKSFDRASILDVIQAVFNASDVSGTIAITDAERQAAEAATNTGNRDYLITETFTNATCLRVLQRVCRSVNWYWYIDHTNEIQVVDSFEYEYARNYGHERFNISWDLSPPTGRTFLIHELQYVKKASPGKLTPPYQKVVVTGASSGPGTPPERKHMQSKNPIRGVATSPDYSEGDPVFPYRDEILTTDKNAQAAAQSILEQLLAQQTGGWVELVGHPLIRPNDVIEMPGHMGAAQYLVADVNHTIDNNQGFTTRVKCSGLMSTEADRNLPTPFSAARVDEMQDTIHNVPVTQR